MLEFYEHVPLGYRYLHLYHPASTMHLGSASGPSISDSAANNDDEYEYEYHDNETEVSP